MSEKHYYQPEIETMPEEQIRALQSEKLVKAVQHVYAEVPYYRDLMDKAGAVSYTHLKYRNIIIALFADG